MEVAPPVPRWETDMDFFEFLWTLAFGIGRLAAGVWQKNGAELSPNG